MFQLCPSAILTAKMTLLQTDCKHCSLRFAPKSMAYEGMIAETVRVHGHDNELIDAYAARPLGAGPLPGVLVVHHMPGWDEWTREVVRKVAHHGFNAVAPDLHFRQGPGTPSEMQFKGGRKPWLMKE